MTPHDAVCCGLTAITGSDTTHEAADTMLEQLSMRGFVIVTRELVKSVLEDAEALVNAEYVVDGEVHPANRRRYRRDMADILALRAEMGESSDNST